MILIFNCNLCQKPGTERFMSPRVLNLYALAPLQRGLLFHAQTQPEARVYHQQLSLDFEGALDTAALRRAFASLIDRHDVLRTGFEWEDLDEPLQVVFDGSELPLRELDLRGATEPALRLAQLEREEREAPFDLSRPPLMRVCLVRLGDAAYRCIWTHHHIILDGWSVGVLLAEWRALYLNDASLPASMPYASFIEWLAQQDVAAAKRYFGPLLATAGEPTPLPSFAAVGGEQAHGHAELELRWSAKRMRSLLAAASGARVTPSTLPIAAFARVLARHAGREGALLGLTLSGRPPELSGSEQAVGLFINTLPLWIPHHGPEPVRDILSDVASRVQNVWQHGHAPLSAISALSPHAGSRPPFEAIVVVENYPVDRQLSEPLGAVSVRIAEPAHDPNAAQGVTGRNEFPLSLIVVSEGGELSVSLSYDRARLSDAEVLALRAQLELELLALCGEPLASLRAREAARLRELGRGASTSVSDATLHGQLARVAVATPDALAVIDEREQLTYAELTGRASAVARALAERGIARGSRVAIALPRSAEWVVAMWGVLECGAAFVPLDESTPAARARELLADSGASALISTAAWATRLGSSQLPLVSVADALSAPARRVQPVAGAASDAAYLIYTSGSTGKPKAVVVEHRAIALYAASVLDALALRGPLRFGWLSTVAADLGYTQLFAALLGGGCLCVVSQEAAFDPLLLARTLASHAVDVLKLTPSHLRGLLAAEPSAALLPRRTLIFGGEALDAELVQRVRQLAPALSIYNHYGPTEAAVGAVYWPVPAHVEQLAPATRLPLGRPLPGRQLYVLDAAGQPCPEGVVGELYIGGDALAREYLGRPELTAERFLDAAAHGGRRMYRTGDRVRWLLDGSLAFLGRVDRQVKIRGFRVELGEVEAEIARVCPHVREVVVRAIEQAAGGLALHAFVVADTALSVEKLRDDLAQRLPEALVPSSIVTLDAMPLTPNGKIDQARLVPAERPARRVELAQPATPLQAALAEIWQGVLRVEPVGVHDSFFQLGGDSILSLQIVARARQQGIVFTPQQLLSSKTIAALCEALGETREPAASETEPGSGLESIAPLLPAQRARLGAALAPGYRLLRAGESLDPTQLERALAVLAAGHVALRLGWTGLDGSPLEAAQGISSTPAYRVELGRFELRELAELPAQAARLLGDPRAPHAPTLVAALGHFAGSAVLLLVAHPLCLDDASWPTVLRDLSYVLLELADGRSPQLPARGRELLGLASESAQWSAEAQESAFGYWLEHPSIPPEAAPLSAAQSTRAELRLSKADSARLTEVCQALHCGLELPLVAALRQLASRASDAPALAIELPAGRAGADALAAERLVGALTQTAPLYLSADRAELELGILRDLAAELAAAAPRLAEHVRLCHGASDEFLRDSLLALPRGTLAIRMLGSLDAHAAPTLAEVLAFDSPALASVRAPAPGPAHATALAPATAPASAPGLAPASEPEPEPEPGLALSVCAYHVHGELHIACEGPLAQAWTAQLGRCLQRMAAWDVSALVPPAHAFPLCRDFAYDVRSLQLPWSRIEDVYPLTPMQHGMLLHTLLAPGSGIYLMQQHYEWNGALDHAALVRAWGELLAAHPVLRTGFELPGELPPVQCVYRDVPREVPLFDLRGLDRAAAHGAIERELEAELSAGFVLSAAPLTRLRAFRLDEEQYVLVRSFHHVLNDAWCFGLIMDELLARYRASVRGLPYLRPGARPYRDYIAWLGSQDRAAAERFYRELLSDVPEPTPLPQAANPARGAQLASAVADVEGALSIATTSRIAELCQQLELTPNTFVQGAWAILLARHARAEDCVFGVTVAGRPAELDGVEDMVGLFIHSLPLRVHVADHAELGPWLTGLFATNVALRGFEHASLVEIAGFLGRHQGQPLFESLLVFENAPLPAAEAASALGVQLDLGEDRVHTNFPLTVVVYPGDKLGLRISYDCAYYDQPRAAALLEQLLWLLEQMAERPEAKLGSLELVSPRERQRLLGFNRSAADFPLEQSYASALFERVTGSPERIVARCGADSLSYGELWRRSGQLAAAVRAAGVQPGECVVLAAERGLPLLCMLVACLRARTAFLSLEVSQPNARLAELVGQSGARVALIAESQAALWRSLPLSAAPRVLLAERVWLEAPPDGALQPELAAGQPDDLAYVMFTSGSTGVPKGVMIEQRGMLNNMLGKVPLLGLSKRDHIAQIASCAFDVSVWQFLCAPLLGASLEIFPDVVTHDPAALLAALAERAVSVAELVPSMLQAMLDVAPAGHELPALRWLIPTGEAVPGPLCRAFLRRYPHVRIMNAYGPAECSDDVTMFELSAADGGDELANAILPIGRPTPNNAVWVADAGLRLLPPGAVGELIVTGVQVGRGYLRDEARTRAAFVELARLEPGTRAYRTGDLGRYRDDGVLEFWGRADDQVKLRGHRIELREIEARLLRAPGVAAAAVVLAQASAGPQLVGYVERQVSQSGCALAPEQLRAELARELPGYMVPACIEVLPALPRSAQGKLDRAALRARAPRAGTAAERVAPATELERALHAVWAAVLERDDFGMTDDFFALGGHSLLATQVRARIAARLGVSLPLRAIFADTTLAQLAERVERERGAAPLPAAEAQAAPAGPGVGQWLSFAQQRLWFLEQLHEGTNAFLIAFAVRLRGPLQAHALEQALAGLIARHDALRSAFFSHGGEPRVRVEAEPQFALERRVVTGADEADTLAALCAEPLPLTAAPMLRASLLERSAEEHVLVLRLHHIAADGWSVSILCEELAALYDAALSGRTPRLAPAPSYVAHARRQRLPEQQRAFARSLEHFQSALAGCPTQLTLPGALSDAPSLRSGRLMFQLPAAELHALQALAAREQTTLFTLLYAALCVLVHQQTGQRDFLIGTDVANRTEPETERMVGFFVNQLVLRAQMDPAASIRQLIAASRETLITALEHQSLPFDQLVAALLPGRERRSSPLFQMKLVLQNVPDRDLSLSGITLEELSLGARDAELDLLVNVTQTRDGLALTWDFRVERYAPAYVERLGQLFLRSLSLLLSPEVGSVGALVEVLAAQQRAAAEAQLAAAGPQRPALRRAVVRRPPTPSA